MLTAICWFVACSTSSVRKVSAYTRATATNAFTIALKSTLCSKRTWRTSCAWWWCTYDDATNGISATCAVTMTNAFRGISRAIARDVDDVAFAVELAVFVRSVVRAFRTSWNGVAVLNKC